MFKEKKILILGAARSGLSAAKILSKDNNVILTDLVDLNSDDKNLLMGLNVDLVITKTQEDILDESFDFVVKNPGVMPDHPLLKKCRELNIPVINEMEVAYNFLPSDTFIIGVTGSNGKTTTSTIICEILKEMNIDVVFGGNIGTPLCDLISKIKKDTVLLLEISDHQLLNFRKFKTDISLLTNICPTHLDYHKTYENYKNTKAKIFDNHTKNDIAIINENNSDSKSITENINSSKIYFNNDENFVGDDGIYLSKIKILSFNEIKLIGNHNYENILSALMVVQKFGLDIDAVKSVLSGFNGVEHRIEFVKEISGVKYYNDSKATNPTSVITALKTFDSNVHLILGGLERTQDFSEIEGYLDNVVCIYAIGEVSSRICAWGESINKKVINCVYLKEAIKKSSENSSSNDIVLLSPASASQDQYKKFEDRGDEFKKLVFDLKS